jgi:cytoplasmic iron level regulating protein YaaA (DUF328/UPF0246 family)
MMEPLWLCRDNFIRTTVRKLAGRADKAFRRVAWQDAQVLILLPPSEKKNATSKPTPAINVYTGVLYQALDWASLSAAARKRAASAVVIISAKYGAVRPSQLIESYKEKIDNKAMREPVAQVLDAIKAELIVDCRSSTYKTVWHSPIEKTVEVRVSTVVDGVRTVVTHMSKKTRGEITRWLLQSRSVPKTPEDLYAIVSEKYPCALTPTDGHEPWILEVIAV